MFLHMVTLTPSPTFWMRLTFYRQNRWLIKFCRTSRIKIREITKEMDWMVLMFKHNLTLGKK
jgi:hypothetical protein